MIGIIAASLLAATPAPVTSVTVFGDRARVTRTADVRVSGAERMELPLLPQSADLSTVRVDAVGAAVERVELEQVLPDAVPVGEARKLLERIEALDNRLVLLGEQLGAYRAQAQTLAGLVPTLPPESDERPWPKVDSSGWVAALSFVSDRVARAQSQARELENTIDEVQRERARLGEEARLLGGVQRTGGWRVVPTVSGTGAAQVRLTYMVSPARWVPTYDLQLSPDTGRVELAFSGLVSQETGEDWTDAMLTLSTAQPVNASQMPKLATWKLGEQDRFIPTSTPLSQRVRPAPPAPPLPQAVDESELLRRQLLAVAAGRNTGDALGDALRAGTPMVPMNSGSGMALGGLGTRGGGMPSPAPMAKAELDFNSAQVDGEAFEPDLDYADEVMVTESAAPRSTARAPSAAAPPPMYSQRRGRNAGTNGFSLAPPSTWRAPQVPPQSPAALAGGYDLAYASFARETIQSGKGARRVPLFADSWPVKVERRLFPAVAPEAYLVAELKSPAKEPLPGGIAQLYVGADPAGQAQLELVSPGEPFTLPLGIDRALKPVRNVQLLTAEKGFIGKDEVNRYLVTIELANPYARPIAVKIIDQWPLSDDQNVQIKLLETKPWALQDAATGQLEWHLTLPPRQTTTVSFRYELKRPKHWKLHQQEVAR